MRKCYPAPYPGGLREPWGPQAALKLKLASPRYTL